MSDFDALLAEQLKDPEFKAEWDPLQAEFEAIQAEIDRQRKATTEQTKAKGWGL